MKKILIISLLVASVLFGCIIAYATLYEQHDFDSLTIQKLYLILDDFSGGLNNKFPDDAIQDNESPDLLNVRIDGTSVGKRLSYVEYNATALSEEIDSTYRYYEQDGTKNALIQEDTALWLGDDSLGTFTSKSTAITDGSRLDYCVSHDVAYMTNESDTPLCYVGGTTNAVFEWGCQIADVSSTDSTLIDGDLDESATYQYKITHLYHGYEESSGSDAISVTTGNSSNDGIDLDTIPVGDARVTARKIYRTEGDGDVFYYLATISDNTDTTYTDIVADTSLDTSITCPTDNGLPPTGCQWTFLAANRVFLVDVDNSKYYYSRLDYPDIFPAANFGYVFRDDGEQLQGYAYWRGIIYWFKNTYITATVPNPAGYPLQWSTPKSIGKIAYSGTVSGWSIQPSPSGIYYLAPDNIYLFTGNLSQPIKEGIEGEIDNINSSYYSLLSSTYWNNTYRLSYVSVDGAGTTPDRQIIWDEFRKAYVIDDKDITCYSVWNGESDSNELYAGTTAGYLVQEEGTTSSYTPFIHNTTTEIETGTETYVETGGTETNPTLVLDDDTLPTAILAGNLLSDVQSITATEFGRVYFNKQVSGSSDAQVYIRTGDVVTPDATWTAWMEIENSGDYPSTTTATDYLQYKAVLTGEISDFEALNQTSRLWTGMASDGTNVYASVYGGDIYMQTAGAGDFVALGQTTRNWYGMASDGTNVYACVWDFIEGSGGIYMQTAGAGDFVTLSQTSRKWTGMASDGTDVWACAKDGDIYKQTAGTGDFVALNQTSRSWRSMTTLGTNVYACVNYGDIYKQTAGTGDFVALSQTSRQLRGMASDGTNVYASVSSGDIYMQTAGVGDFVALGQTSRKWRSMTNLDTNIYACVSDGDIYKQSRDTDNTSLITADGYFIRVDLGKTRTAGETTISFEYKTKKFNLSEMGLDNHKKEYFQHIIEYESEDTGTLYMDYWIEDILQPRISIDLETYPTRYDGLFEEDDWGRDIQFLFTENSLNEFTLKRATIVISPKQLIYGE